ncbi:hypothetical protein I656_03076 [Geobacillus sp. WSUCF1]|nr:hypothetical protein I656_03076 [Geobacillus sp. WSUCF1]
MADEQSPYYCNKTRKILKEHFGKIKRHSRSSVRFAYFS